LVCEALLFDWAESNLQEAESLYEKYDSMFTKLDKFKFMVKKSSFHKKFGFFDDALDILLYLEKELMAMLKNTQTPKINLGCKKLLYKAYRDQARLFALKRDE